MALLPSTLPGRKTPRLDVRSTSPVSRAWFTPCTYPATCKPGSCWAPKRPAPPANSNLPIPEPTAPTRVFTSPLSPEPPYENLSRNRAAVRGPLAHGNPGSTDRDLPVRPTDG